MDFEYIDLKRRQKGLSITKFCELAEIDRSTYYKIQQNSDIKLSTLRKIFEVLDMNLTEQKRVIS